MRRRRAKLCASLPELSRAHVAGWMDRLTSLEFDTELHEHSRLLREGTRPLRVHSIKF